MGTKIINFTFTLNCCPNIVLKWKILNFMPTYVRIKSRSSNREMFLMLIILYLNIISASVSFDLNK